jgi:hypothetical protein
MSSEFSEPNQGNHEENGDNQETQELEESFVSAKKGDEAG